MRVQLLFFQGCAHVDPARQVLREALESAGLGEKELIERQLRRAQVADHSSVSNERGNAS
jgi:hypothetical protein